MEELDDVTRDEIQERLDAGKDLNENMTEALHGEGADTDEEAERNFQAWIDARNKPVNE